MEVYTSMHVSVHGVHISGGQYYLPFSVYVCTEEKDLKLHPFLH